MASRSQRTRKQRRKREQTRAAERPATEDAAGAELLTENAVAEKEDPVVEVRSDSPVKKGVGARFGRWADRLEEAADERPPAVWGGFPLGPLAVLAGLVLIVVGVVKTDPVLMTMGVGVGAVGGLELAIREHFTGFRSHTSLLGGIIFVAAVWVSFYLAHVVLWACLLIGAVLAVPAFWWFRKRFEKPSGGLTYKLR